LTEFQPFLRFYFTGNGVPTIIVTVSFQPFLRFYLLCGCMWFRYNWMR
jgi:hypothetical protein